MTNSKEKILFPICIIIFFIFLFLFTIKMADPVKNSYSYYDIKTELIHNPDYYILVESWIILPKTEFPLIIRLHQNIFGHDWFGLNGDWIISSDTGNRTITKFLKIRNYKYEFNIKVHVVGERSWFVLVIANEESMDSAVKWANKMRGKFPKLLIKMEQSNKDASTYFEETSGPPDSVR